MKEVSYKVSIFEICGKFGAAISDSETGSQIRLSPTFDSRDEAKTWVKNQFQ